MRRPIWMRLAALLMVEVNAEIIGELCGKSEGFRGEPSGLGLGYAHLHRWRWAWVLCARCNDKSWQQSAASRHWSGDHQCWAYSRFRDRRYSYARHLEALCEDNRWGRNIYQWETHCLCSERCHHWQFVFRHSRGARCQSLRKSPAGRWQETGNRAFLRHREQGFLHKKKWPSDREFHEKARTDHRLALKKARILR